MKDNLGIAGGTLRFAPRKVAEGVVMLTLRIRGIETDKDTGERKPVWYFPSFIVFGREAYKALTNLEEGQKVDLEYHLETQTKVVGGEKKFFEDKVVDKIVYGEKRPAGQTRPAAEPRRPAARSKADPRDAVLRAETISTPVDEAQPEEPAAQPGAAEKADVAEAAEVPYAEVAENAAPAQRRSAFGQLKKVEGA